MLREKELREIPVADLCKAADIERSTFYANFEDTSASANTYAAFIAAVTLGFSVGYEDGIAAVTHTKRSLILCHHKAEHHLQTDQQRMEIPHDSRLIQ